MRFFSHSTDIQDGHMLHHVHIIHMFKSRVYHTSFLGPF